MRHSQILPLGLATLAAGVISACSSGDGRSTGTVSYSLMDRPIDDVTALYVTISEVRIKPQGDGPATELPMTSTPLTVNLLELNDENASVLVDEAVIDAGSYNWVELQIEDTNLADSYALTTSGGMVPVDVDVPSNRIRLVSGFEVGPNQAVRILLDWDVRAGLANAVGQERLLLRPAFRILDADEYGSISGTIADTTIAAEPSCQTVPDPAVGKVVYFFEGDVTPDDMDGNAPDPVTTADAVLDVTTSNYDYRAVLMPGEYTVAFTCEGALDTDDGNPETSEDDEVLVFLSPVVAGPVVVTAETPVENVDF